MSSRIQGVTAKEYKGVTYRSTLEADTAEVLDKMGIPFVYEGRRITLLEGFYSPFQKDKVRAIHYTPDFEIGNIIIECKGFETPEWKNKKKYLFKYLQDNEPETIYHQTHDAGKTLLEAIDPHLLSLGYAVTVTPKPAKRSKETPKTQWFDSVRQAMGLLNLQGKALGPIVKALMGKKEFVYGYKWKLNKLNI